jgi:hypothetical protein
MGDGSAHARQHRSAPHSPLIACGQWFNGDTLLPPRQTGSLTTAERDEPGPGGDFVSILGIPDESGEKPWCLAPD